eukprot:GFKZ01008527.1.p1 GENE.GFKZ01008527.1~~GFKZ01008527.1.p1  ORF type:complete len:397 (+),score=36.82 GFKZ01008527.1:92-1282(+)
MKKAKDPVSKSSTPCSPQASKSRSPDIDVPHFISDLSFHSLRVELSRRKLSTSGLRCTLERRLSLDIAQSRPALPSVHVSLPSQSSPVPGVRPVIRRRRRTAAHVLTVPKRFPNECELYPAFLNKSPTSKPDDAAGQCNGMEKGTETAQCHGSERRFVGILRPRSVWMMGQEQILAFWNLHGPCGKANLSRSAPSYSGHEMLDVASAKGRALRQLLTIEGKQPQDGPRGESEDDNAEHLQLTLVEAFYLLFVAKCLVVRDANGGSLQDASVVWKMFAERDARFPKLFVAYSRYRAAGWLPRSGVKYGVNWVLYPANAKGHAHAPYCIVLKFEQGTEKTRVDRTWTALQNRLRLSKTVAKNLVIANISVNSEKDLLTCEDAFRNVRITEVTIDRWLP